MTPRDFIATILDPGLAFLDRVGGVGSDDRARLLLAAIAIEESGLAARLQAPGPARGWWQMERAGGVRGVLNHPRSAIAAAKICSELCIPADETTVYEAMAWSDLLSAAFARLLLWTDTAALPPAGSTDAAYAVYLRCWRPGKPSPKRWAGSYQQAMAAVGDLAPPQA
jgi:hypothetical protein